ncbi:MAG TPA: GDSL-type esterase/lipase family protein [Sunxiuqinia sp.]|nr:GDSL-type esterase/lipase family protein [Sunxiuqinia sp.]
MNIKLITLLFVMLLTSVLTDSEAATLLTFNRGNNRLIAPAGIAYRWYRNGKLLQGVNTQKIVATLNGAYRVEATNANGTKTELSYSVGSDNSKSTVFVIGDSTAATYDSSRYPRTGWAQVLQPFFNSDSVVVSNHAASGRSSKSFYDEGRWTQVYNALSPGDYVFIQFAHNDEKTNDPSRYTDPETTYKYYIKIFVNGALEKGAYPILISSIPRNNWSGSSVKQAHAPYTKAMKEIADSMNVPFIDMEASTMAFLDSKGKSYATDNIYNNLPAGVYPNYPSGNSDGTHLQENGAFEFCKIFVADLRGTSNYSQIVKLARNKQTAIRIAAMPSPYLTGKISGTGIYPSNTSVTLTETPASGYQFSRWTLTGDTTTYSTEKSIRIETDSTNISLQVHFKSLTSSRHIDRGDDFKIYPNPVNDQLHFRAGVKVNHMEIFDLHGKRLKSVNVPEGEDTIDLRSLPAGTYLVKAVSINQKIYSRKIVKQ